MAKVNIGDLLGSLPPRCRHHEVCGLDGDDLGEEGLCILHSRDAGKDPQAFREALSAQQKKNRNNYSFMVFPEAFVSWGEFFRRPNFFGATFHNAVSFKGVTFDKRPNFFGATFMKKVDFSEAKFPEGVNFGSARFHEEAAFFKTIFETKADFREAKFHEFAQFNTATFKVRADFSDAHFSGRAYFYNSTLSMGADFDRGTFEDELSFDHAKFGERVDFFEATLTDANFFQAAFSGVASFRRAKFKGKANFWAEFAEDAEFTGARFFDVATFSGAAFNKKADFPSARFSETAWFVNVKFSGDADFSGSSFAGRAHFRKSAFNKVVFDRGEFCDGVSFEETLFRDDVSFKGCSLGGRSLFSSREEEEQTIPVFQGVAVDFRHVTMESPELVGFRDADLRRVRFLDTDLRKVEITGATWAQIGKLAIRFGVYDEIAPLGDAEMRPWSRLERLNRHLKQNYEENKDYERAGDFHYGAMEMRRRNPATPGMLRFFLTVYWLCSGYGERYLRPLICLGLLLCITTFAHLMLGISPIDGGPELSSASARDWLRVAHYGFRAMVLLKPEDLVVTEAGRFVSTAQNLLGPLFIGLFALALRQRLKR